MPFYKRLRFLKIGFEEADRGTGQYPVKYCTRYIQLKCRFGHTTSRLGLRGGRTPSLSIVTFQLYRRRAPLTQHHITKSPVRSSPL